MSARDSAAPAGPGNNQAGGLGNGGIGGGFGGGAYGGGGGYGAGGGINGGYSNRTGLTTGNTMYGNSAYGPSGGMAQAYGTRDYASLNRAGMGPTVGSYGNFQTPQGQPMYGSSPVQGQSFNGMNMGQALSQANRAQAAWQAAQAAHPQVGGLLDPSQGNVQPTSGGIVPNGYNTDYAPPAWAPPYTTMPTVQPQITDDMVPGYGTTYTPPSQVNLPTPAVPPTYYTHGGWPGQNTYYRDHQIAKVFENDRVPQEKGWGQSNSYTGRSGR